MQGAGQRAPGTLSPPAQRGARAKLASRLALRRGEIEAAVMTRVWAMADPKPLDVAYVQGLRMAVGAAIEYGLCAVEFGEQRSPPPPPVLLAQARMAARSGVGLDTVLRRYFAGHSLFLDFLICEAEEEEGLSKEAGLRSVLRAQHALFDRLIGAVSEEHRRESASRASSAEERRAERVRRLLDGELVEAVELNYELDAHHLGLLAQGPWATEAIRGIARLLDRRLLLVRPDHDVIWAWLGGSRPIEPSEALERLGPVLPPGLPIALGEPAHGLSGWRLTHCQAKAALPIALRGERALVRYADVALLASMLQDELLATSLQEIYLRPLEGEKDGGKTFCGTLRTYFEAGRNVASAASALGVHRNTVANRLRVIEMRTGRSLDSFADGYEAALRLANLAEKEGVHVAESLPIPHAHRQ